MIGFAHPVSSGEWIARCFTADADSEPRSTQADAEEWVRMMDVERGRSGAFEIELQELPPVLY